MLGLAHMERGLSLIALVGGTISFMFLGGACGASCKLGWVVMAYQFPLTVWLVLALWSGLTRFVQMFVGTGVLCISYHTSICIVTHGVVLW